MFIARRGPNREYAYVASSTREGNEVKSSETYLGRIIDFDKHIFKDKEHGYFQYDLETEEYKTPDPSFVPEPETDKRKKIRLCVDFGDAYFVNEFLHVSGLMKIIDSVSYGNPDTLHAMILFYVLSSVAGCDAINWYEGSITRYLYPKANMTSQRLSDFLASIGSRENVVAFEEKYINYIFTHYSDNKGILIDSTGLQNSSHLWMTQTSNHNGEINREIRLIFVVQKTTGLPLFYQTIPGNVVDVSTLERVLLHMDSLNVQIDEALMDCGYNSKDNLDIFYGTDHALKINYITRVKANDTSFVDMVSRHLSTLETAENFIKYQDRYLFIIHEQVKVGRDGNNPAFMYLGLDMSRMNDEQKKLFKRANKNNLSVGEVFTLMQNEGLFGLISGRELSNNEILPCYYQRQDAEQIFDFAKNYTRLLPLRIRTDATLAGHMFMSFMATIVVKMIQLRLKTQDMYLGSRLVTLRNLKCIVYSNRIVTDHPQKVVNDSFASFKLKVPTSLPVVNGILQYNPPKEGKITPMKPKVKSIASEKAEKEAKAKEKAEKEAKEKAEKEAKEKAKKEAKVKEKADGETHSNEEPAPQKEEAGQSKSEEPKQVKKRGRPPKPKPEEPKQVKKRGRPPKPKLEEPRQEKKRGRPPKPKSEEPKQEKKRGRPPKPKLEEPKQVKKRGRPPKPKSEETKE